MTDLIPFPAMPEEEDPQALSREALLAQAQELRKRIADLDAREPADMMSAQYERWAARHEPNSSRTICMRIRLSPTRARKRKKPETDGSLRSW